MNPYHEHRYYSIADGRIMVRLSVADERGGEFFVKMPRDEPARRYRERRDEALAMIEEAIEAGLDPGEVIYEGALS